MSGRVPNNKNGKRKNYETTDFYFHACGDSHGHVCGDDGFLQQLQQGFRSVS